MPILLGLVTPTPAQDTSYVARKYDERIYLHQDSVVRSEKIDKDTYIRYTMPFSKWDTRPLNDSLVWIMGEEMPVSTVPNFYWGAFAGYYGLTEDEVGAHLDKRASRGFNVVQALDLDS